MTDKTISTKPIPYSEKLMQLLNKSQSKTCGYNYISPGGILSGQYESFLENYNKDCN